MNLFLSKAILPAFIKQLINIMFYRGYSLRLLGYSFSRKVVEDFSSVTITVLTKNNGLHKLTTGYLLIQIIDPYKPKEIIYSSDRDLGFEQKRNLIVYDVKKGRSQSASFTWTVPSNIIAPALYIKIDIWSPRKLYRKRSGFYYPFLFDTSGWKGFIEIVKNEQMDKLKIFISYAWVNEDHRNWVLNLADLLTKNGFNVIIDRDLLPGQEITKFMEKKIVEADIILLICSEVYTKKANDRTGGAGYETIIATQKYYSADNKEKFIPVTRNNTLPAKEKLPTYLGSSLYVDMDNENWQSEPLQKLIQALGRFR